MIDIDINKMMVNGIFTMNDKHAQSKNEYISKLLILAYSESLKPIRIFKKSVSVIDTLVFSRKSKVFNSTQMCF